MIVTNIYNNWRKLSARAAQRKIKNISYMVAPQSSLGVTFCRDLFTFWELQLFQAMVRPYLT